MSAGGGQFRERLMLMRPIAATDALGGSTPQFYKAALIWAKLAASNPASANRLAQNRIESRTAYRFLIRRRTDVSGGWRLVWRGRLLNVTSVIEQEDRSTMMINAEEGTEL